MKIKMKKILITGTAGFIGSHLAENLLSEGYKVIGIDNFDPYYPRILKEFNLSFLIGNKRFEFYEIDILNVDLLIDILKEHKPEYIIHCAAKAGVRASVKSPLEYFKTNVLGTINMLEALRKMKSNSKIILLSSSSVYGVQSKTPFSEDFYPNPTSPYGVSKWSMEVAAKQYFDIFNLPIAIVRPFSIYGPRGRIDMAPFLIIKTAEKGEIFMKYGNNKDNKRDWTFIEDFIFGIFNLIRKWDFSKFEIFNLGNSYPVGIDDFVDLEKRLIKEFLGKNLKIEYKPRPNIELPITFADITKSKKVFGYNPKVDFEEGLVRFFKFYVKYRDLYLKIWRTKK